MKEWAVEDDRVGRVVGPCVQAGVGRMAAG